MSVYIDNWQAPFRGMLMCHMIADTHDELIAMVDAIGVQRRWIQKQGTRWEHFDICLSKKELALRHGAVETGAKELVKMMTLRPLRWDGKEVVSI